MKYFTLLTLLALFLGVSNTSAQSPIFTEGYAAGVTFAAFGGSTNNVTDDATVAYSGTHSLKIEVTTGYTGGALVGPAQDLSAYNAVSFWVKASAAKSLNVSGLGNNGADATYQTELGGFPMTTTWTKVIIPIPNPAKFTSVTGLFHFAEGSDEGAYTIWMDDIQYETTTVGTATATINAQSFTKAIGETFTPTSNGTCAFSGVAGATFNINSAYFTYASANSAIATMNGATGVGTAVAAGTTTITAMLGAVAATGGPINVTVTAAPTGPTVAASTPTKLAADVKSLFSNAYTDLPTDTWRTGWSSGGTLTEPFLVAGNDTKKYENLNYAGITFEGAKKIDATLMTGFHLDMWTLDPAAAGFKVKLVDFGANGAFGGGDDTESGDIALTTPGGASSWSSFDLPLSAFMGAGKLAARANLAQMVIVSAGKTIWIDNVYFYVSAVPTEPTTAAATPPARGAASVISLFSGAYTDVAGTEWNPTWSQSTAYSEVTIATNPTKKYETMNYQGIVPTSAINATSMEFLHIDLWTPNITAFNVFLINPGPVEQSVTLTPTLSGWNSFDIPLSSFNTINLANVFQLKLVSTPFGTGTAYVDNMYFYSNTPTAAATTPMLPQANVISLFSNTYTNQTVDTWRTGWSSATVTDMQIAGNDVKKCTGLGFFGAQFSSSTINTVNATHFHLDVWAPNAIAAGVFKVKLVDFGADGTGFGPADNTEGEVLNLPAIAAGTWTALDIPLADFMAVGLGSTAHLAQLIPSGGGTVFMDNIYFYANAVLAVELTTVKAKAVNTTTVLTWQTASEKDNAGFTIERSANGTNFTAIGNVKGNGTTNATSNYTFTDATPLSGVNYYRLRQADFNGKETLSKVVSVAFGKNVLALRNTLVQNTLEVIVSEAEKTPLSIFNISGQLVFSATVQGTQVLDVSHLTAGLYIVRMGTGKAQRFVKN